jgi:Rps23 Pro-64 3,4-dihydroxylase Tpa1-like proline 4-hydroxylase
MAQRRQAEIKDIAVSCSERIHMASQNGSNFDEPFKHCIIDNFFPDELAKECLSAFPLINSDSWERSDDADIEVKLRTKWESEFDIPEDILTATRILNSSIILKAMSEALEIKKLIPDPYYAGGGLNATVQGGLLDIHVDGNYHDPTGLDRRVNAILYLNPVWFPDWGGELGLYDTKGDKCVKRIAPLFNRLVLFETHDFSFHGLPDPLNFKDGHVRRSLILYYYTKDPRPTSQVSIQAPHSALWKKRGLTDKRGNKTRKFE